MKSYMSRDREQKASDSVRTRSRGESSSGASQLQAMEARANQSPQARHTAQLRALVDARPDLAVPRRENSTGMPDHLKTGLEQMSGMDLSGVQVHYNSAKPAQLNALAYTQGSEIHVAPGQEKHLPHEGWHAVQQMQGRVRPTMRMAGTAINDDAGLEREADQRGNQADRLSRENVRIAAQRRSASGSSLIQRKVNLDDFFTPEDRERLFSMQLGIDDLEEIQDLLADEEAVGELLSELEGEVETAFWKPKNELKYTRALESALFDQESKWMKVDPKLGKSDREVIPMNAGVEANDKFLGHIATVKPLKDAGAAVSHGEYAHRLQWYLISRSMENNFQETYGEDFLEAGERPSREFKWLLQTLYGAMSDPEYTKMFEGGKLKKTDKKERNSPQKGQFPLPLWSAVLDMPGSFVDLAKKDQDYGMFGDIFAAAPVKLTGGLTFAGKDQKGGLQEGPLAYSQLSLAVLNRRLKRYLQGGPDQTLKHQLESSKDGTVRKILDGRTPKDPLDYDQRNEIAFRLLGIL